MSYLAIPTTTVLAMLAKLAVGPSTIASGFGSTVVLESPYFAGVHLNPKHRDYVHINCWNFSLSCSKLSRAFVYFRGPVRFNSFGVACGYPPEYPNFCWQLALYAVHLATGNNVFYLRDVATFLSRFSPVDARYRNATDKTIAPIIKAVTDEVIRWENIPDRREPSISSVSPRHSVSMISSGKQPTTFAFPCRLFWQMKIWSAVLRSLSLKLKKSKR
jgi:hypothetical protein